MARLFSIRPAITLRGRRFQGIRGWTGKPSHPPLTDFPIVCYVLAAGCDVVSLVASGNAPEGGVDAVAHDFFMAATIAIVVGFVVSLATALTGFLDWWKGIPRDRSSGPIGTAKHTQVWRTINWHATVMIVVTLLTLLGLVLRVAGFDEGQTQLAWLVLSCLAGVLVLFGAAYGGTLVFEYGFNVENIGEVWNVSEEDHVRPERKKPSA